MAIARHEVEFTKDGAVHDGAQVDALINGLPGVTDLIVLSHGWNNDMKEARELYDELLGNVEKLLAIRETRRRAGGAGASEGSHVRHLRSLLAQQEIRRQRSHSGRRCGERDRGQRCRCRARPRSAQSTIPSDSGRKPRAPRGRPPWTRRKRSFRSWNTTPRLAGSSCNCSAASSIHAGADADDGSREFFAADPEQLFKDLNDAVVAPAPPRPAARPASGTPEAQRASATCSRALAPRRAGSPTIATYYQMKSRAGTVGKQGLAKVLRRCRTAQSCREAASGRPQLRRTRGHGRRERARSRHARPSR